MHYLKLLGVYGEGHLVVHLGLVDNDLNCSTTALPIMPDSHLPQQNLSNNGAKNSLTRVETRCPTLYYLWFPVLSFTSNNDLHTCRAGRPICRKILLCFFM